MKMLCVAMLIGLLSGCATTPSGHWEQAGRTEMETNDDHVHCQKVAMQEANRNRTDEPFKEAAVEKNCMQRMGYTYINDAK